MKESFNSMKCIFVYYLLLTLFYLKKVANDLYNYSLYIKTI